MPDTPEQQPHQDAENQQPNTADDQTYQHTDTQQDPNTQQATNLNQRPTSEYERAQQPGYYDRPWQEQPGTVNPPPSYPPPYPPTNTVQAPQNPYGQPYVPPPGYSPYPNSGPNAYSAYPAYPNGFPPPGYIPPPLMPPPSNPLPLGEALRQLPSQYFRVLTKPRVMTFLQEQGKAAWNINLMQIVILTLCEVILSFISVTFILEPTLRANTSTYNQAGLSDFSTIYGRVLYFLPLAGIITVPAGIFIASGIYYGIANLFRGRGPYATYLYCYLLFQVPLGVLIQLFSLIPYVGGLASIAGGIYAIVLQVFMTMAVMRLRGGRATFAVLLLPIIVFVLAFIVTIILIIVFVASLHRGG